MYNVLETDVYETVPCVVTKGPMWHVVWCIQ